MEIKRGLSYREFELLGVGKKKYWKLEGKGVSVYFSIQSGHILLKYNYQEVKQEYMQNNKLLQKWQSNVNVLDCSELFVLICHMLTDMV